MHSCTVNIGDGSASGALDPSDMIEETYQGRQSQQESESRKTNGGRAMRLASRVKNNQKSIVFVCVCVEREGVGGGGGRRLNRQKINWLFSRHVIKSCQSDIFLPLETDAKRAVQ